MTTESYSSNEVGALGAIAGASPMHTESLSFLDPQFASYQSSAAFQPSAIATTLISNDARVSTTAPVANPIGWVTKQNWARHQEIIRQLYLCEKKPLTEVMRFMESHHGFRATPKMYKTHIKQWGLDKKNKEFEMRAIVRKQKQREDQGKGSTIRVRGQSREFAEVVRYWNRKGVAIDVVIARQTASPTPETVELFTPVPSPILTPQVLAIPERIFYCIRDYFRGSFESGTWIKTEPLFQCYTIKDEEIGCDYVVEFGLQCQLACSLFSRNLFQEAGQILIAATAKIKKILSAEHPECLGELFRLIVDVRRREREEIALIILRQFSALGKVLLGPEHPLSCICEWLDSVYAPDFDDIVIKCMESMVDQFESCLGSMHLSTLSCRLEFIDIVSWEGSTRIELLQRLLDQCEKILPPYDVRILPIRGCLADEYFAKSYYVEARTLSQKNIAYSQQAPSINTRSYDQDEDLYTVAQCQYALGEVGLGITTLHRVIDSTMSRWGPQDSRARYWLVYLEDWYLEQGLWSSAAQVRYWREKTLESMESII